MDHHQGAPEPAHGLSTTEIAAAIPGVLEQTPRAAFTFRIGRPGEHELVIGLLDDAVAWLTARGITAQWGTQPFSEVPPRVAAAREWVASGGTVIATNAGGTAGALVLGTAPDYVPPADCREVYVVVLVAGRHPRARGVGTALLDLARRTALATHADRVRVDCYAGGDQALVRFYEANGFARTDTFRVGDWPGQVLEWRPTR